VPFLLDTHALIWWLVDQSRLPRIVVDVIEDRQNTLFVSAASAMEMTTKHRLGKLSSVDDFIYDLAGTVLRSGFELLSVEFNDAVAAGQLTFSGRDPFDRLLIAQAINRNFTLISNETIFDTTNVTRLWA
jgi:PIN domain nuclease of toxin-antitoxin system